MKAIGQALRDLETSVRALDSAVHAQQREAANIPRTTADIEAAIEEWLAADEDATAHFDRFPNTGGVPHKDTPPETQEDWSRCCDRMHAAKERLVAVANALRGARERGVTVVESEGCQ